MVGFSKATNVKLCRTCWASLVLNASRSNSTAAEGSTNLRVEPTIRANRQRSSCMKATFLLSCEQRATLHLTAFCLWGKRLQTKGATMLWADPHSHCGSCTSPGLVQTDGSWEEAFWTQADGTATVAGQREGRHRRENVIMLSFTAAESQLHKAAWDPVMSHWQQVKKRFKAVKQKLYEMLNNDKVNE